MRTNAPWRAVLSDTRLCLRLSLRTAEVAPGRLAGRSHREVEGCRTSLNCWRKVFNGNRSRDQGCLRKYRVPGANFVDGVEDHVAGLGVGGSL